MTTPLFNTAETILTDSSKQEEDENKIIDDYKKLNEKCDTVITKIKIRKEKRAKK